MKTNYKAIQTRYKNCKFRSRLEARWAVFFDHCGLNWQYEPEGFEFDEELAEFGYFPEDWEGRYLPDFYIPEWKTWIEIKAKLPDDHFLMTMDEIKVWCLAKHTGEEARLLVGLPDHTALGSYADISGPLPRMDRDIDPLVLFACRCDRSKAIPGPTKCMIANATQAALSARFEFGESGAQ